MDPDNESNDPPTPWAKSKAKKLLHDDIASGETKKFRGPTGIFQSRKEFQRCKFGNFSSNCCSLRKAIEGRLLLKSKACDAFQHDKPIVVASRGHSFCHPGSNLEKQLRCDVQKGCTDGVSPADLVAGRHIFRNCGLTVPQFSNFLSFERRRHQRMLNEEDCQERMRFINARIRTEDDNEDDNEDNDKDAMPWQQAHEQQRLL